METEFRPVRFSFKLAVALEVGIGLSLLGSSGYRPNVEQSEKVVFMLRVLYALVSCVCNLIVLVIFFTYPITEESHVEL